MRSYFPFALFSFKCNYIILKKFTFSILFCIINYSEKVSIRSSVGLEHEIPILKAAGSIPVGCTKIKKAKGWFFHLLTFGYYLKIYQSFRLKPSLKIRCFMKYVRKIKKHFEYISNKDYLRDCASNLSLLKCASALLEGACCHFFTGEEPLKRANELLKIISNAITNEITISTEDEINLYGNLLTALCAHKQCTKQLDADNLIDECITPLLPALFNKVKDLQSQSSATPCKSLSALNAIADYYASSPISPVCAWKTPVRTADSRRCASTDSTAAIRRF